jgi:hypothetical protein
MSGENGRGSRSLITLISELPGLVIAVIKAELNRLKAELADKAKHAAVGMGMFVGAAVFAFFGLCVLIATAVLGLAVVLPAWLAALIVAVALLVIAGILALVGVRSFKKMGSLAPERTIASVKDDIDAIKGMGSYDR